VKILWPMFRQFVEHVQPRGNKVPITLVRCSSVWRLLISRAKSMKKRLWAVSTETIQTLLSYEFPENIRELRNLIERACILSALEEITSENFPVSTPRRVSGVAPRSFADLTVDQLAALMPETHNL
jgi:DNA-binding NtrC family response regulator